MRLTHSIFRFAIATIFLGQLLCQSALAQKPPAPPPPTNPGSGSGLPKGTVSPLPNTQPEPYSGDLVLFLAGNVKTDDGTALPSNVIIERVCNSRVRQQVYADSHGEFSMELGRPNEQLVDASGDATRDGPRSTSQASTTGRGVPRQSLTNCEMRASASGFFSDSITLVDLEPSASSARIGSIVVHRSEKVAGQTLSAAVYRAPKNALNEYLKGAEAEKKEKLAEAETHLQRAVKLYPQYAYGWFGLGEVLRKESKRDQARTAYQRATALDGKFLQPVLGLASMAFEEQNWQEVLQLTRHMLNLDTLDYGKISGYVLDLDSLDYSQAYFYNAAANFKLDRLDDAEKSGMHAERLDVRPLHPQLRLLMAEIYLKKKDDVAAADQLREYLGMMPKGPAADHAREQLRQLEAKLAKTNAPDASGGAARPD
jgi:tetratricopeptide (TPR) repeat protein